MSAEMHTDAPTPPAPAVPATRVQGEVVELDYGATRAFFDGRARLAADLQHPYAATMYQDDQPELVAARDRWEKGRVLERLAITAQSRVLDVGCGVGRWADAIVPTGATYLGTDFADAMLREAARRVARVPGRVELARMGAQEISARGPWRIAPPFDRILVSGVLLYLNDVDVLHCLAGITEVAAPDLRLYLREPVSVGPRLSLDRHPSAALRGDYSAIYRPAAFYRTAIEATLGRAGFALLEEDWLMPPHLENRVETRQRFFLIGRPG